MKKQKILFTAQASMIAAIYVVLTVVFAPLSFWEVQVRIAEALTILPLFTPAAIPGLFAGCLLGNILSGAILPDIIFGSLATLAGAFFTYQLRSRPPVFGMLPPIISNTVVVPLILRYGYGILSPIWILVIGVGIGEILSCGVLGRIVYTTLSKYKNQIFKIIT